MYPSKSGLFQGKDSVRPFSGLGFSQLFDDFVENLLALFLEISCIQ